MKKSELRQLIREELTDNGKHGELESKANEFIRNVLKLGSKQNIFDIFLRKNKMNPDDLSEFTYTVANTILSKW